MTQNLNFTISTITGLKNAAEHNGKLGTLIGIVQSGREQVRMDEGGGLSLMFECLTSLTVGNPLIAPFLEGAPDSRQHMQNGLVIAIDIAQFGDVGDYAREVDRLADAIKSLPRAEGVDEILVPGERGDGVLEQRRKTGIPLPDGTWKRLEEVATRLGVAMPKSTPGK